MTLVTRWLTKSKPAALSPRWLGYALIPALATGAAINDYYQWHHARHWTLTPYEVVESKLFCVMQYKSGKSWRDADTIECPDVEGYKSANDGTWRSVERMHHRILLGTGRKELPVFLPEGSLSAGSLAPKDSGSAYVSPGFNPDEPFSDLIARPRAARDNYISAGFYGAALLSGFLGEWFHRRRKRSAV